MIVRGSVLTMDPARPRASAFGVRDGRVVAVDDADGPVLDLGDATILPGFVDAHNHMLWTGLGGQLVDLSSARSVGEALDAVRAWAAAHPSESWVVGAEGWEVDDLAERRYPSRAELDSVCPDRPVFLGRGGHAAAVSSRALELAGVGPDTPDPPGGVLDVAAGLLLEGPARELVRRHVPRPGRERLLAALRDVQDAYVREGITRVIEPGLEPDELAAYQALAADGELRVRVTAMPMLGQGADAVARLDGLVALGVRTGFGDERLMLGGAKLFLDGGASLGTAFMREPYPADADPPGGGAGPGGNGAGEASPHPAGDGYRGELVTSEQELHAVALACARHGWSLGVHAVGGAAIDLALDVFARVDAEVPIRDLRFTLIHAYLWPTPANMEAARRLGVVLAIQPTMQERFAPILARRFGWDAIARATPLRAWHDAGVVVAGSSDSPITPFAPRRGIWQAVTRHCEPYGGTLGEDERIGVDRALTMYTTASAHAAFADGGRLRPGAPADWVALPADPTACPPDDLRDLAPIATAIAGELVHEAR